jgi:hypothetical protein
MSERKRFYRVAFCVDDIPNGTMLLRERTVEMAISRCAQIVGNSFSVHSVTPIFISDEEEYDFMHFIITGNPAFKGDVVDIEKRLKGEQ